MATGDFKWLYKMASTKQIEEILIGKHGFEDMETLADFCTTLIGEQIESWGSDAVVRVNGPNKLVLHDVNKDLYKQVGFIGGEKLEFKGCRIGKRDGLLMVWESPDLMGGIEGEIETTCKRKSHQEAVAYEHPGGIGKFMTKMLGAIGDKDLIEMSTSAATERKAKEEKARLERMTAQKEHYGGGFGSWS